MSGQQTNEIEIEIDQLIRAPKSRSLQYQFTTNQNQNVTKYGNESKTTKKIDENKFYIHTSLFIF